MVLSGFIVILRRIMGTSRVLNFQKSLIFIGKIIVVVSILKEKRLIIKSVSYIFPVIFK